MLKCKFTRKGNIDCHFETGCSKILDMFIEEKSIREFKHCPYCGREILFTDQIGDIAVVKYHSKSDIFLAKS